MKNFVNLAGLGALVFCVNVAMGLGACQNPKSETLDVPTSLTADNVSTRSATLAWNIVPGAEKYEVSLVESPLLTDTRAYMKPGDKPTTNSVSTVAAVTHSAINLKPGTEYTWQVRAVCGNLRSEAATATFTTVGPTEKFVWATGDDFGNFYGEDSNNIIIAFAQFDAWGEEKDMNGIYVSIDLISPAVEVDRSMEFVPVPAGVYTVGSQPGPFTALVGEYTCVIESKGGKPVSQMPAGKGTVTVEGGGDKYVVTADFMLANGETFLGRYTGPLKIANKNYLPPTTPLNLGTITMSRLEYGPDCFGNGSADGYFMLGLGEGVFIDSQEYVRGDGWSVQSPIFAPAGSGPTIPDGVYRFDNSLLPGTVLPGTIEPGEPPVGSMAVRVEAGQPVEFRLLTKGTIKVSSANGEYTVTMDAIDHAGSTVSATIKGTPENPPIPFRAQSKTTHNLKYFNR